nr:hypothetical protein Ade03nite_72790 [Actinoplanes derwentensis]
MAPSGLANPGFLPLAPRTGPPPRSPGRSHGFQPAGQDLGAGVTQVGENRVLRTVRHAYAARYDGSGGLVVVDENGTPSWLPAGA